MSEAAYPKPRSLPPGAKASMRQTEEITIERSTIVDQRPTQEFKDLVERVIIGRPNTPVLDRIPLSQAIDNTLGYYGITR